MNLSCLLPLLRETPDLRQLIVEIRTNKKPQRINILDASKPYFVAALYQEIDSPVLVVTAQPEDARRFREQLQVWCPRQAELFRIPELDFLPFEKDSLAFYASEVAEKLRLLSALAFPRSENKPPLIVSSALAAITKTISLRNFQDACQIFEPGDAIDPLVLVRYCHSIGYEVTEFVETPGQVSRRGGIVDVFSPSSSLPVRIEFSGDRIESMRYFEPESQRSTYPASFLIIAPAKELFAASSNGSQNAVSRFDSGKATRCFQKKRNKLEEGELSSCNQLYSPLIYSKGSIFEYLKDDALYFIDDPIAIETTITKLNEEGEELRTAKISRGELSPDFPLPYLTRDGFWSQLEGKCCLILETWQGTEPYSLFKTAPNYSGRLDQFFREAKELVEQKRQRLVIVTHQANRLVALLEKAEMYVTPVSDLQEIPPSGSVTVVQGSLSKGWVMNDKLALLTDTELFGFVKQPRRGGKVLPTRGYLLSELSPGDYVVHVDHGIGRFRGLIRLSSNGTEQDYLVLEYAGGDKLYVPADRIDRISRYVGVVDQPPNLSHLRTPEWQRTKKRIREAVTQVAKELLELYATREIISGFAFSPDSPWQQELEASFPYVETPDQLEAIMAVKKDMEKPKPMDRLICGDVGYGKTEIALRAAFKAVMDNKQVAMLVPTTVLAQQHFITFTERLQTFPVEIAMLSRFCPREKEKEILEGLANGAIDICIGTHRLLQKDVKFKDLGLVIIDEEQQFGVVQKEKLKQLRKEVDTVALSATPIPRTLYMALTGIRDISIVETPPAERLPIKTYVGEYDASLVRQVILRELERNGQVFFVHNRVQSISLTAEGLRALVPEARIAIAHGQMPEEELERVMTDFVTGKYDVLVTTTIVQLGLDMPNVNTLIVDEADKLGLAQLYQLRGRIGRGINQAYAYFFFNRRKRLTPQALKRLKTIAEATELGSGFSIAVRDLEIRGAGNLLGVKQSGHIAAVGFDLYCRLLSEAVEELKAKQRGETGKKVKPEAEQPSISLPLAAHIPEEYVPDLNARLNLYHRMARISGLEEVDDLAQELRDRFGILPQPVENLLYVLKVKILATKAGISSISAQGRQIVIKPRGQAITHQIREVLRTGYDGALRIGISQIRLDTRLSGDKWKFILEEVLSLFSQGKFQKN